jgi:hypothetical protein
VLTENSYPAVSRTAIEMVITVGGETKKKSLMSWQDRMCFLEAANGWVIILHESM